jgi:hypothetical protein
VSKRPAHSALRKINFVLRTLCVVSLFNRPSLWRYEAEHSFYMKTLTDATFYINTRILSA